MFHIFENCCLSHFLWSTLLNHQFLLPSLVGRVAESLLILKDPFQAFSNCPTPFWNEGAQSWAQSCTWRVLQNQSTSHSESLFMLRCALHKVTLTYTHLVLHLHSQMHFCRTAACSLTWCCVSSANHSCHLAGFSICLHTSPCCSLGTLLPGGQDHFKSECWPKASLLVIPRICRFDTAWHATQALKCCVLPEPQQIALLLHLLYPPSLTMNYLATTSEDTFINKYFIHLYNWFGSSFL